MSFSRRDIPLLAIAALLISAAALLNLAHSVYDYTPFFTEGYILTNKILIAAMGASITAATTLAFFSYSNKTDQTVESHLHNHRLAPGRADRSRLARKTRATRSVCACIDRLMRECALLAAMADRYEKEMPGPKRPQFHG